MRRYRVGRKSDCQSDLLCEESLLEMLTRVHTLDYVFLQSNSFEIYGDIWDDHL